MSIIKKKYIQSFWKIFFIFFKLIWYLFNVFRRTIINLLSTTLIIVFVGLWLFYINNNNQVKGVERSALLLNINGVVVDKPSIKNSRFNAIIRQFFGLSSNRLQENSLFEIVDVIRQTKNDCNITGIILDLKNFIGADQPSMQYIGKALKEFRKSGKPVIAIGDSYSQGQYYLASFANKIWLSPHGMIDLHGLAVNRLYYKSFLEKLKITTHVFRIGTYKSAVEPFIRDNMSPAARDADSWWINKLWRNYISTIAINRQISNSQIFPGAQKLLKSLKGTDGDRAKYALENKLVDAICTKAEVEKSLTKQFGWNKKSKNYNAISIYDYTLKKLNDTDADIAVIFVNGIIMDGEATPGNVSSDTIKEQIRNARLTSKVKAIVLRVNSPGGSVDASEAIREEIAEIRKAGKPVVVSMGGMAASGGYWISTPANYILANSSTLTGSIGIFGIISTVEKSLDYLGIHTDGIATSPLADVSITKTLPIEVSKIMQLSIENGYKRFITLVAQSRKKTLEQVNQIAQGRIWTGQDAKNNGLIDNIGDFDNAITKAAELTKLKKWHVKYYQNEPSLFSIIMENMFARFHLLLSQKTNQTYLFLPMKIVLNTTKSEKDKFFTFINDPENRYAFCLSCSDIV